MNRHSLSTTLPLHFACLLLLSLTGGCKEGIPRSEVYGTATLDGKPIPSGQIKFIPVDGPVWSATIEEGRYSTKGTKGVPSGEIRIEIRAFRTPASFGGRNNRVIADVADDLPLEQYLPAKFNTESELNMIIQPGINRMEENFALVSG